MQLIHWTDSVQLCQSLRGESNRGMASPRMTYNIECERNKPTMTCRYKTSHGQH